MLQFSNISLSIIIFNILIIFLFIWIDYINNKTGIIPDNITYPLIILGIFLTPLFTNKTYSIGLMHSFIGLIIGFGILFVIFIVSKEWVGGGIVKAFALLGTLTGLYIIFTIVIWFIINAITGLILIRLKRKKRGDYFYPLFTPSVILTLSYKDFRLETLLVIIFTLVIFIIWKIISWFIYKLRYKVREDESGALVKNKIQEESFNIVSKESEVEIEISYYENLIIEKENCISELSLEIQNLKLELNLFESKYNAKVGVLYVELDKLNLKIKEYEYRIKLAKNKKLSAEDLQEIESKVEEDFQEERKKVDDVENEVYESSQEYEEYIEKEELKLDEETEQEIKQLYRNLVKKYHPDMAKNEEESEKFHEIMAEINKAYKEKDIETLRKFTEQLEREEKVKKETPEEKLERLREEIEKLDRIIKKFLEELKLLKSSETYKLMEKIKLTEEGVDLLEQLAKDVKKQISDSRHKLNKFILEYQEIIEGIK